MLRILPLVLLVLASAASLHVPGDARRSATREERVVPNDNREAGGTLRSGMLTMRLEARLATWHPDGDDAPGAEMPAFGEEGGPTLIPGPLIRVRPGTAVEVSVRNRLADTLVLHGLHDRLNEATADTAPLVLAPGERRTVRFRLAAPGTYHYWGTTTRRAMMFRTLMDAQLTGAIVVDDANGQSVRDRIFVIGMWTDTVHRARTKRRRVLAVINGRSWPNTERLSHAVGDTVRWRLINASADLHPMHLHGFYFRIDSRGDGRRDTWYDSSTSNLAVTASLSVGQTMHLTWIPERPGNWLFHCHIPDHFAPRGPLGTPPRADSTSTANADGPGSHGNHSQGGMSGLVMGITVREGPNGSPVASHLDRERHVRLLVRPQRGSTSTRPLYSYTLHEDGPEPPVDSSVAIGPILELVRGRRVHITVVNRLPEPTSVHWHGIELESYYDGVPGFSGVGKRVTPLIAPGDSFEVRFTPPRAGTFIYHTHADEERQQTAGLAGPIIVREDDTRRDPETDIPILITEPSDSLERAKGGQLVNGSATPPPLVLTAGHTYRLRFIQMSVSRSAMRVELFRDTSVITWRPVAKDGADLLDAERVEVPSRTRLGIGETFDVELTPAKPGDLRLELRAGLPWPAPSVLMTTLPIRVSAPEASERR